MNKISSYFVFFIFLTFTSTSVFANSKPQLTVETAFKRINHAVYLIEETKRFCDESFPSYVERNTEAYNSWELQYNFFLREVDTNYEKWKNGFAELQKQQFPILDQQARKLAYLEIASDYADGAADKCFNYRPSLSRPRSNLEMNHQPEINLIRNRAMQNFRNDHSNTGANPICQWEQENALNTATMRDEGKDQKSQNNTLSTMKKDRSIADKKEHSLRIKKYSDIIKEVYNAPNLKPLTFSQYRFALCERDLHVLKTSRFRDLQAPLLNCQQNSEHWQALGSCISSALD